MRGRGLRLIHSLHVTECQGLLLYIPFRYVFVFVHSTFDLDFDLATFLLPVTYFHIDSKRRVMQSAALIVGRSGRPGSLGALRDGLQDGGVDEANDGAAPR